MPILILRSFKCRIYHIISSYIQKLLVDFHWTYSIRIGNFILHRFGNQKANFLTKNIPVQISRNKIIIFSKYTAYLDDLRIYS